MEIKEIKFKGGVIMDKIVKALEANGYDYAIAIATEAEITAKAACGQLSIIG